VQQDVRLVERMSGYVGDNATAFSNVSHTIDWVKLISRQRTKRTDRGRVTAFVK
jgi:hypothetical protein